MEDKIARISLSNKTEVVTTNDMEDVRHQLNEKSAMDGNGFLCVTSIYGKNQDINLQHVVRIEYVEKTSYQAYFDRRNSTNTIG